MVLWNLRVFALQEWESILFDQSLNQWVVEDMIAHDIVEGVF